LRRCPAQGIVAGSQFAVNLSEREVVMAQEVRAPLAGNIWSVLVEVGAKVEEDDELLVIEALKMENPVCAPGAGTVKEIRVKKGDKVEEDAVLMVLE
jgi:acetyl-CoA carboxylase biotin carboxyl carrier protein